MKLVLNNKYEVYRSVAATFENWDGDIPAALKPGNIVTLVSVEDDKNVVVRDKNKECWFIRYTSLKNIDNADKAEEEAPKEEAFNWANYKALVRNKQNDIIVRQRECNLFDKDLVDEGVQYVTDQDHGLCTFIYDNKLIKGYVCYAPAMGEGMTNFGAAFNRLRNKPFVDNGAARYVEWLANESALAGVFIAKTFDEITTTITPMAFDEGEEKYALAACIALRWAYERDKFLEIWNSLVEKNVDENIAMYIAVQTIGGYNTGNSHSHIYSCRKKALIGWTVRDLPRNAKTVFEATGNSVRYGADECLVRQVMIDLGFLVKDQYGYYKVNGMMGLEMRLKIAEGMAKAIEKELNQ